MNDQKAIDILNSLIQINNDRVEGYQSASEETEEADLKNVFARFSANSLKFNNQLIGEVENLNGEPIKGTTTSGIFYRIWMDAKAAITNKDRRAILNSCEYGEEFALRTYETALNENPSELTSAQVQLVENQYAQLQQDHVAIQALIEVAA